MGQAPSAAEGRREDGGDEDDLPCGGRGGCLPTPRFLRRNRDDIVVFENYSVATDEGPDDLALTDVEDEGEDNDEVGEDSGGVSLRDISREAEWLPECVADLVTAGGKPLLSDPDPDPNLVPTDVEEEEVEGSNGEEKKAVIPQDALEKIVAVDCGMVMNCNRRDKVRTQALRRVSVVDGHCQPLYSALVRVDPPPVSYLSGMILPPERRVNSFGDDFDVGVPASEVREEVSRLLRGKIVVGHSVGGDLAALGLGQRSTSASGGKARGFEVRDTASYAPFMRKNGEFATLRELVKERLNRDIQLSGQFHCCEEDAVAALDLYKSVWHEWESMSLAREQTQKAHTTRNSSIGCEERREKKKQKRKRKMKEVRKLRKLRQYDRGSRLVGRDLHCLSSARHILVSSLSTFFDTPALFSSGVFRGIVRPAAALVASGKKRWNGKKKKKKKKKTKTRKREQKTHRIQLWFKRHRSHCDSFFLLCHCLLEARYIVLSFVGYAFPAGWDAPPLQGANGALIAGLVGMKLLRMGKHRDQSYFGMLAQYRVLGTLVRMMGCQRSDEVLAVPVVQDRAHFAERMLFALASQIMHGTPTAIAFPIQTKIIDKTARKVLKTESMMDHFLPIVKVGGTFLNGPTPQEHLSLACSTALACWFILRYTKKL